MYLYIYLYIYVSIYVSIYLSMYLSVCLLIDGLIYLWLILFPSLPDTVCVCACVCVLSILSVFVSSADLQPVHNGKFHGGWPAVWSV